MSTKISKQTRRELLVALRERYRNASKIDKSKILDEFIAITGRHRKYAIRLLTGLEPVMSDEPKLGRTIYSEAVREALVILWEAADRICGKRLKAILPGLISAMERHGHLALDPNVRQLLLAASPATIDRLLAPIRGTAGQRRKRKSTTKSSREIPVRTFADWNEPAPGFLEVDFVAHSGDSMQGTFLWSLVATDVCSGWTEAVALVAREQSLVVEGLEVIEYLEAFLRLDAPEVHREYFDLGLPSETVSGLSEPGHAGGKFPRPGLHERLERVLERTRPDLVVACYGMNDGIYYPLSQERFTRFQDGMRRLRERATAVGARVLHITPPVFDRVPILKKTLPAGLAGYPQPYEGYDDVLDTYSRWLLDRKADGWDVVDVHGPMRSFLSKQREQDPDFRLSNDGVHCNALGHWIMARQVLEHWGVAAREVEAATTGEQALFVRPHGEERLKLVQRKQRLLKDAWLNATEHQRPGMKRGLPLDEARQQAKGLDAEIDKLMTSGR